MGKQSIGGGGIKEYIARDVVALTPGANVALDGDDGNVFTLTPAEAEAITASGFQDGEDVYLKILTSGTDSFTLTFGSGFKVSGTLATGTSNAKVFVLHFVVIGGVLTEVSRTAAM